MARLVPVTVRRVPPLKDEGDGNHGWKFRGPLPPARHKWEGPDTPPGSLQDSKRVSLSAPRLAAGPQEGERRAWCRRPTPGAGLWWLRTGAQGGRDGVRGGLRGQEGDRGAQGTWDGGRGVQGGLPPVDAPLRVNPQDGGVLGVVVFDLGIGELSAVDVDDDGGTAGALPGGRQASDLPGIPPEDAGAGAHLRRHRAPRLHHQQAEREPPARPLRLPTYGTGHNGPVSRRGPLPRQPLRGARCCLCLPGPQPGPLPRRCPAWAGGVLGSAWLAPRLRGAGPASPPRCPGGPHPRLRLLGSVNRQACPRPSLQEPGPRVQRAGLPGGKGLTGLRAALQRPHQSPGEGGQDAAAGPLHGRGPSTGGAHGFNVLGGLEGRTRHTHPPPPSSLI